MSIPTGTLLSPPNQRERGFALLVVLLTLAFLSLLVARTLADARVDMTAARIAQQRAQDDASLYSATQTSLFHLLDAGKLNWPNRGTHSLTADHNTTITIQIRPLDQLLPFNSVSAGVLGTLFQSCGLAPQAADTIARGVLAHREPQAGGNGARPEPIRDWAEIGEVQGLSPGLIACASPHLSFYQEIMPGFDTPDPVVRQTLTRSRHAVPDPESLPAVARPARSASQSALPAGLILAAPVVRIDLDLARGETHRHTTVIATLAEASGAKPYAIRAWRPDMAPDLR